MAQAAGAGRLPGLAPGHRRRQLPGQLRRAPPGLGGAGPARRCANVGSAGPALFGQPRRPPSTPAGPSLRSPAHQPPAAVPGSPPLRVPTRAEGRSGSAVCARALRKVGGYWVTTSSAVDEISDTPDSTSTGFSSVAVLPLPICPAPPKPRRTRHRWCSRRTRSSRPKQRAYSSLREEARTRWVKAGSPFYRYRAVRSDRNPRSEVSRLTAGPASAHCRSRSLPALLASREVADSPSRGCPRSLRCSRCPADPGRRTPNRSRSRSRAERRSRRTTQLGLGHSDPPAP